MGPRLALLLPHAPVAVAAALSFSLLGAWPLWQDEAFSWALVQGGPAEIVAGAAGDRHPPLYYLLMAPFARLFDRDELVRLPSALAFVASVAVLRHAAARYFGPRVAEVASWALAISPFALLYAETARMYAMLLLWGALLLHAGLDLVCGDRPGRAAIRYGIVTALAIWTHYVGMAAVVSGGLGVVLGLWSRDLDRRERLRRLGMLVLAGFAAGLTFLPWALGPLQFQLASKDAPAERTWTVLAYALWNFDSRIPLYSWLLVGLQLTGLAALVQRNAARRVLLGWVLGAVVLPWALSRSGPAQNPRNYSDFLPAAMLLAGLAAQRLPRLFALAPLALAVEPLADLWTRPVSPQETGIGFDYQHEADVFDASVPRNAGLYFRPVYMITQYRRYAPALEQRAAIPVDANAWVAVPRTEWLDASITVRFSETCTFRQAFRVVVYAPDGPGCDAMQTWIAAGAEEQAYVPFLVELATRALTEERLDIAEGYAERAATKLRAHPAAWLTLAEIRQRRGDFTGMLEAADAALAIARRWRFPGVVQAGIHRTRARALALAGHKEAGDVALADAVCAAEALVPAMCGTVLARFVPRSPADVIPATLPPLPTLSEPQEPPPPVQPPAAVTRLAMWPLDGEALPEGWIDGVGTPIAPSAWMEASDGPVALQLSVTEERTAAVACAPFVDAAQRMAIRARWKLEIKGKPGYTRLTFEARLADAGGTVLKLLGMPVAERPLQTASPTTWRVDRFDFRTRHGARVRLCAKLEGTVPARAAIDWLEIGKVEG